MIILFIFAHRIIYSSIASVIGVVDYYFRLVKFEIERSVSAMAKEFREPTGVIIPEVLPMKAARTRRFKFV